MPGQATKKTLRVIDFEQQDRNQWEATSQFYVQAQRSRKPDVVLFCNGIPVIVIECKSPLAAKDKNGQAFDQIKQYERDIPRLFLSNIFNIISNGIATLYGATGSPSQYWGRWEDPWPKSLGDFPADLDRDIYSLCEPSRVLDILAHFLVFERDEQRVIKKVCRYQQFRAVNKLVQRVVSGHQRRGLIWHTQGSGKSLTMVFAVLKLKWHLGLQSDALTSPNILVLTDRVDLDEQITGTFQECGLPNPVNADSKAKLREMLHAGTTGLTVLSTIFKFEGLAEPVANSAEWIVLVDECHRTQERDLGAFLRASLPEARFFGFTGTPIKTTDKDTYANFGAPGEGYLDKYGIDDAVRDGATVPIRYTSRKAEWQVDPAKLDILFDQWFADQPEEVIEAIKKRGVTIAELAKHPRRVELIAFDIWTHFQAHCQPDGLTAQIVAIDREAVILYKRALDAVITQHLLAEGMDEPEAATQAAAMSACVYSSSQEDGKPSEEAWLDDIRAGLVQHAQDKQGERDLISRFKSTDDPLYFLIVCNKLLTGFDAPSEGVMYLDNPLKEHNLLQAIARTNRVAGAHKQHGLIVDYIGVTKKLDEALATYRADDVCNAMRDLDEERAALKEAHKALLPLLSGSVELQLDASESLRQAGDRHSRVKAEFDALVTKLGTEDAWLGFKRLAKTFVRAYEALSPDPGVLPYQDDMKWVVGFLAYATLIFEKKESLDLKGLSAKVREMLREHLEVTGISTICKLRHITDPEFQFDFDLEGKSEDDLKTAAIRKATELKRVLREKVAANEAQYGKFSERVLEVLARFEQGQISAAEALREYEQVTKDLLAEEDAHRASGLSKEAYGVLAILEAALGPVSLQGERGVREGDGGQYTPDGKDQPSPMQQVAMAIDELYRDDDSAPPGWHRKEGLRQELRMAVRRVVAKQRDRFENWKDLPTQVDAFAVQHYIKG